PPVWFFACMAALVGTGEAFFGPALDGLTVELVPAGDLSGANALCGLAQSATGILGPSLAGLLVAAAGPAPAIALDAASYAVSVAALAGLKSALTGSAAITATATVTGAPVTTRPPRARRRSLLREAAEGWGEFRARTWLWVTTVQFALY